MADTIGWLAPRPSRGGEEGNLFNGGVTSPFFVRWPGITPVGGTDTLSVISSTELTELDPVMLAALWRVLDYQAKEAKKHGVR